MAKRTKKRQWWQKPKNVRRLAMAGIASLILVVGVLYFALVGGSGGTSQTSVLRPFTPATDFSLPTTAGGEFTSSDYFGKENVLLYFNEGMG